MFKYLCYKGHALRSWVGETYTAICPDCGSSRIGARIDSPGGEQGSPQGSAPPSRGNAPVLTQVIQGVEEVDVLTRDEFDASGAFDSVRAPRPFQNYALIDDIQVTEGRDGDRYEIVFTTIDVSWFDALPDSMEGMTPDSWRLSARRSKPARLELITSETRLHQIIDGTSGEVSLHAGNWVLLELVSYDPETFDGLGLPVTVFPSTGDRVASIGLEGPYPTPHLIVRIERIRPTSFGLRKLHRFKQAISIKE
ncbi:hypothetical protein [Myxococcus sp. SDU36]|uniref:hypothetical protein n=1 Tax=Myxococcus sp. SDU36 TaxID=2831967 RepID=UPI002543AD1E|nr:hypothetical protein [Myxococcus sp. SDU36]WIG98648.1 hypothetical protein KGD87_15355 [Myxococcus sp. SDU36]